MKGLQEKQYPQERHSFQLKQKGKRAFQKAVEDIGDLLMPNNEFQRTQ